MSISLCLQAYSDLHFRIKCGKSNIIVRFILTHLLIATAFSYPALHQKGIIKQLQNYFFK